MDLYFSKDIKNSKKVRKNKNLSFQKKPSISKSFPQIYIICGFLLFIKREKFSLIYKEKIYK